MIISFPDDYDARPRIEWFEATHSPHAHELDRIGKSLLEWLPGTGDLTLARRKMAGGARRITITGGDAEGVRELILKLMVDFDRFQIPGHHVERGTYIPRTLEVSYLAHWKED